MNTIPNQEKVPRSGSRVNDFVRGVREEVYNIFPLHRFDIYLNESGQNYVRALRLYAWNIEISAALLGGLHILEVTLSNSIMQQLTKSEMKLDWWNTPKILFPDSLKIINSSKTKFQPNSKGRSELLVPEVGFGFWIGLFAKRYHQNLWGPYLRRALPNYSGTRANIHGELEEIRLLRNRIAHHETVFNKNIAELHYSIIRITSFVNSEAGIWLDKNSRVDAVLKKKNLVLNGEHETSF